MQRFAGLFSGNTGRYLRHCSVSISFWLFFGVLLSMAPLAHGAWIKYGREDLAIKGAALSVIERGELLLICVVLLGTMVGELLRLKSKYEITKLWVGGMGVILLVFCALSYSEAAYKESTMSNIFNTSVFFFGLTLVVCLTSLVIPKMDTRHDA